MGNFLTVFASLALLTLAPPVVFGLAVWLCQRLFCALVGEYSGRPLLLAAHCLSTPLREAGHALGCLLFFHRVEEISFFNPNDPDGELGFVEHSYNPRNPLALLGNLAYALAPIAIGLFAVLVIFLSCFNGVIEPFFAEIAALGERGASFGEYVSTTFSVIPAVFSGETNVFGGIIGAILLLLICLGIHVTPQDLLDALSGFLIFGGVAVLAAFALALLNDMRIIKMITTVLGGFAATVTALFALVLLAALALLIVGGVFFLIRTLFDLDLKHSRWS